MAKGGQGEKPVMGRMELPNVPGQGVFVSEGFRIRAHVILVER